MNRYIVTEIEGYLEHDSTTPGLSYHVIDTASAHRIVATYRSEDCGSRAEARMAAVEAAEQLNRDAERRSDRAAGLAGAIR
jgi:hypothetical protein